MDYDDENPKTQNYKEIPQPKNILVTTTKKSL